MFDQYPLKLDHSLFRQQSCKPDSRLNPESLMLRRHYHRFYSRYESIGLRT
jgi:hypothetical protein